MSSLLISPLASPLALKAATLLPAADTWLNNRSIRERLPGALVETLLMTFISSFFAISLGLLLGLALVATGKRGSHANRAVYQVLSQIVNFGRSMPFIILMVAIISFTRFLVNTSLGWQAACVPLAVGAIPFYARLVENAIYDVEQGKIEAALMMGASPRQITWGVQVREALPALISSGTVTVITLVGYSAMAGTVGGGGLGNLAIQYGYYRNANDVVIVSVIVIAILVGLIQIIGDALTRWVDHR